MHIKRLQLDVEFEAGSLHAFHTEMPLLTEEPPTIITVNGREFEGTIEYIENGDTYEIKITKRKTS